MDSDQLRNAMSAFCTRISAALLVLCSVALLALLSLQPLWAQAVFGSIVGTITDPTGATVANASVTVTNVATSVSQTVRTNNSGNYTASRLIPGTYRVQVEAAEFNPGEVSNVMVAANTVQQANLQLQVKTARATVSVTAAPPPLQTTRADVGQVITSVQYRNLPNLNREFTSFTLLTPGVQRASFSIAPTQNPQGTTQVEVNGMNYGEVGYILDGTDDREPVLGIIVVNPTLDSLSESKITTENISAEFGGAAGGVVTASTKSGGNQVHGDAFLFRRSDALQARDPFTQFARNPVTGDFIPSSLYAQFGGSIGGPIVRNRAFFFLDYQGTRQRVGTSLVQSVPTMLVRNTCLDATSPTCDLSQYGSGAIPNALVTPQGRALLSQFPAPNTGTATSTANNFVASGSGNQNGDQADLRLDDQLTSRMHVFGRYDYANFRMFGAPVFGAAGGIGFGLGDTTGNSPIQNQSASLGWDWALSPSLLTDARFGFYSYHVINSKVDNGTDPATTIGIPNLNVGVGNTSGSPTYNVTDGSISNFGNQNCNCPLHQSEQVFQGTNNWTKTSGNHSIEFGGAFEFAKNLRSASDSNRAGQLTFSNTTGAGSGIAAVLEGQIAQFQRFDVYANAYDYQKRAAVYLQDTWRTTSKLTLNYGVRWDLVFPETTDPGDGAYAYLQGPFAGQMRVAGVGGIATNGGSKMQMANLQARVGFAYQAIPGTVIRGAFGQIYDNVGFFGTIYGTNMTHNLPTVTAENVGSSNNPAPVFSYLTLPSQPAPFPVPTDGVIPVINGLGFQIRGTRLTLPEVNQWNLSLQQQLTHNMNFTLSYVGNVATRIYPGETEGYNLNLPVLPTSPAQLANRDVRRPFYNRFSAPYNGILQICCSQDINSVYPAARANYNALQFKVDQRFAHGLQFLANYTWSRALNYGSVYFLHDPRVDYGPSDTNRNQLFVFSGIYQLPFGQGRMFASHVNRFADYLIGGWQLSGTSTWGSGLPFTPTYAECGSAQDIDTNFGAPGTSSGCRPNSNLGGRGGQGFGLHVQSYDPATHSRRYFTPVAPLATFGSVSGPFQSPAFGTIGNIGRNSFRGPADYFADAALFKTFKITERVQAQFQFQAFNVFNHVPLGVPSATDARCIDCTVPTTGLITSADNATVGSGLPYMRQLQFGARFSF